MQHLWLQLFSREAFDSSHCVSSWWKETFQMWILWLQIFIFLFTVLRNLFSVIFVTFKQTQNVIFCWKLWQHLLVKYFHLPENLVPSCLFFLGIINLDTGSYFCLKIWCNVASFFLGIRNLDKYRLIFFASKSVNLRKTEYKRKVSQCVLG